MVFNDGIVWDGSWDDDKFSGKGKVVIKDGKYRGGVYEGDICRNVPYGKGSIDIEGVGYYEGDWKGHGMYGVGTMCFNDGEIYEGKWKQGEMHGEGKLTRISGEVITGTWDRSCQLIDRKPYSSLVKKEEIEDDEKKTAKCDCESCPICFRLLKEKERKEKKEIIKT